MMRTMPKSRILDPNVRTEVSGTTGKEAERTKVYNTVPIHSLYKEYYEHRNPKTTKKRNLANS